MGRRGLVLAAAALALAGAAASAWAWRPRPSSELPAPLAARVLALSAQLAQIPGPYHLLLGDSHAERLFVDRLCPDPVVNAGFAGARAEDLRGIAEALALPRRAAGIAVTVGTNDLFRRREPGDPAVRERFEASVRALLVHLAARTERLVVAPMPAFDTTRAEAFDAGSAPALAAILARECGRLACRTVDLFAATRSPDALARSPDGVHVAVEAMTGAGGVADRLRDALCPGA